MLKTYYSLYTGIVPKSDCPACRLTFTTEDNILRLRGHAAKAMLGIWLDEDKAITLPSTDGMRYVTAPDTHVTVAQLKAFPAALVEGRVTSVLAFVPKGVPIEDIPYHMLKSHYIWDERCGGWVQNDTVLRQSRKMHHALGSILPEPCARNRLWNILKNKEEAHEKV